MSEENRPGALCRDCDWWAESARPPPARCPSCRSPRLLSHPLLFSLRIAHIDCDAFYAAVEKRDAPELAHRPVIVGGGQRGVVTTACYLARAYGVRSAMPMVRARELCPDAVIVRPTMEKYAAASRAVREKFDAATPLVEPLSLDEAFLDLSGLERLHGAPPAVRLARLAREIESEIGVPISIGLAPNKFLAKIASDRDKPRGFCVFGQAEAARALAPEPVTAIWGVGPAFGEKLSRAGFRTVGDLQTGDEALAATFGEAGRRLARLSRGEDARAVSDGRGGAKSISAETTFETDLSEVEDLEPILWRLCERVARRLKSSGRSAETATLKLKTARFKTLSRSVTPDRPLQTADRLYRALQPLLTRELAAARRAYRLIGAGAQRIKQSSAVVDDADDLFDPAAAERARAERAVDALRARFGDDVIGLGRGRVRKQGDGGRNEP